MISRVRNDDRVDPDRSKGDARSYTRQERLTGAAAERRVAALACHHRVSLHEALLAGSCGQEASRRCRRRQDSHDGQGFR